MPNMEQYRIKSFQSIIVQAAFEDCKFNGLQMHFLSMAILNTMVPKCLALKRPMSSPANTRFVKSRERSIIQRVPLWVVVWKA